MERGRLALEQLEVPRGERGEKVGAADAQQRRVLRRDERRRAARVLDERRLGKALSRVEVEERRGTRQSVLSRLSA